MSKKNSKAKKPINSVASLSTKSKNPTSAVNPTAQQEHELRKQILAIWNEDHNQTIPQIVSQLHFPLGHSRSNKRLGILLRATISTAETNERNQARAEKELKRLKQVEVLKDRIRSSWNENQSQTVNQVITRLKSEGTKIGLGLDEVARLVRAIAPPKAVAVEKKTRIEKAETKETQKSLKRKQRKEQEKLHYKDNGRRWVLNTDYLTHGPRIFNKRLNR